MYYITVKQSPQYHQMSLEEFLFGTDTRPAALSFNPNITNTRTYEVETISERFSKMVNPVVLRDKLHRFNEMYEELRRKPRHELYREFYIPKRSGGLRKIDAPEGELMDALRALKTIFEDDFHALYHTSAFAYVKGRCTVDALRRHQANESKWYAKYDLSNFFGSTTLDFVMKMFSMIFPFCLLFETEDGEEELRTALELAFLDGGLPQGTPLSPMITNIMMIPVDFKLANTLRDYQKQRFVYTRYADDFQISSKYDFDFKDIEKLIVDTLASFEAPFKVNNTKTRYGSSAGRNYNLGLMINADNEITVGYKKKRQFKAMLTSYIMDKKNGKGWEKEDVQTLNGLSNYYTMVEKDTINGIIQHLNQKFEVNVMQMMKADLSV